jgi:GTP diphosphokinase / guanosine-3',5'-bis(diphosphate) 3'-diphosphatase
VPIEVQIRTHEMNDVAESGIAAHWLYKTDGSGDRSSAHKRAREWLHRIIEMQQTAGNPQEFLENVKVDLFPDAVYAFTPKGKIIELPRGSTAVDFAYAIHSNLGNSCSGVRINRRLAPLSTQLISGQTVEIIKSPGAQPNPAWLNFVVTAKARSSIRHYLKNLQQSEAITLGKRLLNRQLEILNVQYDQLKPDQIQAVLKEYKLENENALLLEIGLGNRMAPLIARKLIAGETRIDETAKINSETTKPFAIKGTEGMVVNFPKCCYPIPGDPIIGFASAGRGIVIHNQSCKNIAEFKNQPEKWFNVEWDQHIGREFPARIRMNATNQRGVLATVASAISDQEANIINVDIKDKDDRYTSLEFVVEVRDRQHLAQVMRRIRNIKHVSQISRR